MKVVFAVLTCVVVQSASAYVGTENPLDPQYKSRVYTVCDWLQAAMMSYLVQNDQVQAQQTWELMRTPELNCPIISIPRPGVVP